MSRDRIEDELASDDPEDVFSALVDIGKQGLRDLVDRVVPHLSSETDFLREAALRTLVFRFHLPEYKADAIRMLDSDPDEGVRSVAAMGLARFATDDPGLLQHLLEVALTDSEEDSVRHAAYISALVASGGITRAELPMGDWVPGFDAKADWPLLERALRTQEIPVPPGVAERAEREHERRRFERMARFPIGETLCGGRYVIVEPLRGGPDRGMYRARIDTTDRHAIVTLGPSQTEPEAVLHSRLALPVQGIAPLLYVGRLEAETEARYTGMVEHEPTGKPASHALHPPLDIATCARLSVALAAIVRRAHANDHVIGGLRPELIYVADRPPRITAIAPRCERFLLTAGQVDYGVPPCFDRFYLAPETIIAPFAPLTVAGDVFSLAAIAALWATGEHPFEGEGMTQVAAIVGNRRRPWRGSPALAEVIDAGLAADPAQRLSLTTLMERLEPFALAG